MIKSFKIFENKLVPKVGDYVIADINSISREHIDAIDSIYPKMSNFLDSNIARIIGIRDDGRFEIQYRKITPANVYILCLSKENIGFYSEKEKDLEYIIQAKKYNI
jgi:hypothetical protein